MKRNPYLLLFTLTSLNACTPYGESFDCPPGHGVGCKSLSRVNHMVEEGELPLESVPLERSSQKSGPHKENIIKPRNGPVSLIRASGTPPLNTPHLKIWMTAYKDEEGVFHAPSQLYVDLSRPAHSQVGQ